MTPLSLPFHVHTLPKLAWVSLITFLLSFTVPSLFADTVTITDFEKDSGGFNGTIVQDTTDAQSGHASGKAVVDLSHATQSPWETLTKNLFFKNGIDSLSFWVKSTEANGLTVALVDATGQTHQVRPSVTPNGQWQQIVIKTFESGYGHQNFGGANDGKVHWPAKSFYINIEKGALLNGKGTVWFDNFQADLNPQRFVDKLTSSPEQFGNVFYTNEKLRLTFDTQADNVEWTVKDFWGNQVDKGVTQASNQQVAIQPKVTQQGYYEVSVDAKKDGASLATGKTTFVILSPVDITKMPNSQFGAMTHFAQGWDIDVMPLLAKLGVSNIRDELYWEHVEKTKGNFDFTTFDPYMAEAKSLGIQPRIVMDWGNPFYDDNKTPYTPEGCAAYGRYGQAILDHYGDQIKSLEIWNEYNGSWCTPPASDNRPHYYVQMLKAAYEAIKAKRPDVLVLGGAAVLLPPPYFEGIFKEDGLKYMDGIVIHPYRAIPEGVDEEIVVLKDLMKKYGEEKPIWPTETGYIDTAEGGRLRVARYLPRQYTLLMTQTEQPIFWYLTRDYNEFVSMGLLRDPNAPEGRYAPAPVYAAYGTFIRQMYGNKFVKRETSPQSLRVYQFKGREGDVRVCWATVPSHLAFAAQSPVQVVDIMGAEQTLTPVNGQIFLSLDLNAVYVRNGVSGLVSRPIFSLQPEQRIDLGGSPTVSYTLDNSAGTQPLNGTFKVFGAEGAFSVPAGQKKDQALALPSVDTSKPDTLTGYYEVAFDGKVAGKGVINLNVAEPLAFTPAPNGSASGRPEITIANASQTQSYDLTGVSWNILGVGEGSKPLNVTLPPSKSLQIDLPINLAPPYQPLASQFTVECKGRSPLVFNGNVSFNPISDVVAQIDGALTEWQDKPILLMKNISKETTGNAWLAADKEHLYVAALVQKKSDIDGPLQFGVAPADLGSGDLRAHWYEFRVTPGGDGLECTIAPDPAKVGPVADAVVKSAPDPNGTAYEISIPWSDVAPNGPAAGKIRFAVGVAGGQWGGGIAIGKTPLDYPVCVFPAAGTAVAAGDDVVTALKPLETPVKPSSAAGSVLANAADDFSNVQGQKNWSYGYFDGKGGGQGDGNSPSGPYTDDDFKPMKYMETMWGYKWSGPMDNLQLTSDMGHPNVGDGHQIWSVRRWTSTIDGHVEVSGKIRHDSQGDGIGIKILADGVVYYSKIVSGSNPNGVDYDVVVPVKKGSLVDCALTCGSGLDMSYDATAFPILISEVKP